MKDKNALEYLNTLRTLGSNYGLDRTERLLELLGNPHKKIKLIHIAGTNGKGSTSAILGKILIEHGYKIGSFNSPHLEDIEEIIRINEENILEEELVSLIEEIKPLVNKVIEEGFNHPTEFEVLTCLMFLHLYRKKVDFGIIEVGLGGRLDSTNVIEPILSIITPISFDHRNILGDSIEKIAFEKAGIIKKNINIVTCNQRVEVLNVIKDKVKLEESKLYIANIDNYKVIDIKDLYQRIEVKIEGRNLKLDFSLLGSHQIINLSLAIESLIVLNSLSYIKIDYDKLYKALRSVKWKGRLEVLKNEPLLVIDGAHNIDGIKHLKSNIEKYFKFKDLYLILGILKDKDVYDMVSLVAPMAKQVYTVTANSDRAASSEELKEVVLNYNSKCKSYDDYKEALDEAYKNANKDDLILASGSLYMVGEMRKVINNIK